MENMYKGQVRNSGNIFTSPFQIIQKEQSEMAGRVVAEYFSCENSFKCHKVIIVFLDAGSDDEKEA